MFKKLKDKISEEVKTSINQYTTTFSGTNLTKSEDGMTETSANSKSMDREEASGNDNDVLVDLTDNSGISGDFRSFSSNAAPSSAEKAVHANYASALPSMFSIADDESESEHSTPIKNKSLLSKNPEFETIDLTDGNPLAESTPRVASSSRSNATSNAFNSDVSSVFPVYNPKQLHHNVQSDLESASEVEDPAGSPGHANLDRVSKEHLYNAYQRIRTRSQKYRARYTEVVKAYRELEQEKEKIRTVLTESQDKGLRRIAELREQSQLERQAKAHLEDNFRVMIEERDEHINVLQTQIRLLKTSSSFNETALPPDETNLNDNDNLLMGDTAQASLDNSNAQSPVHTVPTGNGDPPSSPADFDKIYPVMVEKQKRLENLLNKCKDTLRNNKEKNAHLTAEKEQLIEQLSRTKLELDVVKSQEVEIKSRCDQQLSELRVDFETKLRTTRDKLAKMKEEVTTAQQFVEEKQRLCNDEIDQLKDQHEKATALMREGHTEKLMAAVNAKQAELDTIISDYKVKAKANATEILELRSKLTAAESELKQKTHTRQDTTAQLKDIQREKQDLDLRVRHLQSLVDADDKKKQETEEKISKLEAELKASRESGKMMDKINADMNNVQFDLRLAQEEKRDLHCAIERLEQELREKSQGWEDSQQSLLDDVRVKHEGEMRVAQEEHSAHVNEIKVTHEKEVRALKDGFEATLSRERNELYSVHSAHDIVESRIQQLSEEKEHCEVVINELQCKLANLDSALAKNEELIGEILKFSQEKNKLLNELELRDEELESMKKALNELQFDLNDTRAELESRNNELLNVSVRNEALNTEALKFNESFYELEKTASERELQIAELSRVSQDFEDRIKSLEAELALKIDFITSVQRDLEVVRDTNSMLESKIVHLELKLAKSNEHNEAEMGALQSRGEEFAAKEEEFAQKEAHFARAGEMLKKKLGDFEEWYKKSEAEKAMFASREAEFAKKEAQFLRTEDVLKKKLSDFEEWFKRTQAEKEEFGRKELEMVKKLEDFAERHQKSENEKKEFRIKETELNKNKEVLNKKLDDFQLWYKKSEDEKAHFKSKWEELAKKEEALNRKLAELQETHKLEVEKFETQVDNLQKLLSDKEDSVLLDASLSTELESMRQSKSDLENDNKVMLGKINKMKEKFVAKVKSMSEDHSAEKEKIHKELQEQRVQGEELKSKLESTVTALSNEIDAAKQLTAEHETKLKEFIEVSTELNSLKSRNHELEEVTKELRNSVLKYESEFEKMKMKHRGEIEASTKESKQAEARIKHYENITMELKEEISLLKETNKKWENCDSVLQKWFHNFSRECGGVNTVETSAADLQRQNSVFDLLRQNGALGEAWAEKILAFVTKIGEFRKELTATETDLQNLKSLVEANQGTEASVVRELTERNEFLSLALTRGDESIQQLQTALVSMKEKLQKQKQKYAAKFEAQTEAHHSELSQLRSDLDDLVVKLHDAERLLNARAEQEADSGRMELVEVKARLEREQNKSGKLGEKVKKFREEIGQLKDACAQKEQKLDSVQRSIATLETRLETCEGELNSKADILCKTEKQLGTVQIANSNLTERLSFLEDECSKHEMVANEHSAQVKTLTQVLKDTEQKLVASSGQCEELVRINSDLRDKNISIERGLKEKSADDAKEIRDELDSYKRHLDESKEELTRTTREHQRLTAELESSLSQRSIQLDESLVMAEVNYNALKERLQSTEADLEVVRTHLVEKETELSQMQSDLMAEIEATKAENEYLQSLQCRENSSDPGMGKRKHGNNGNNNVSQTSHSHNSTTESSSIDIDRLKAKHKSEVKELRRLLEMTQDRLRSSDGALKNAPYLVEPTEIEYLRNILFEYMMGKETMTLAKVIAAVVKFSDDQTQKVLEKEESRLGSVMPFLKPS